ncbi:hypothetical protein [Hydrogenimonas sp.]|uniref:hypothetical protein n=1 Tax=Hydrogenimonas sp. TaxID=2231112 RepID=UPI0026321D92|nr:hypothetical protein [Hydrogenimonas sp.]
MIGKGYVLSPGWRYILPVWGVTLLVLLFSDALLLNLLLVAASFATAFFFYVPEREPFDRRDETLLAPVDGIVESVEETEGRKILKIRKSLAGSTPVRSPIACEVAEYARVHGVFLDPDDRRAWTLNEQGTIDYRWRESDIRMRVVSGFYALGLPFFVRKGPVHAGTPQALMTDGIVELSLPRSFDVAVAAGDRLRGGYSVLGYGGS